MAVTIICDFDNSLFDTRGFLARLQREWSACGVSRSRFIRSYDRVRKRMLYSPQRHIRALGAPAGTKKGALLAKLSKLQGQCRGLVFRDVAPCLRRWKRDGYRLILLTYGDRSFQKAKLEKSGIGHLFERVIVTRDPKKFAMVRRLATRADQAVIIDDNLEALRLLHRRARDVLPIHMIRYTPVANAVKRNGIWSVSNLFQADLCLKKETTP